MINGLVVSEANLSNEGLFGRGRSSFDFTQDKFIVRHKTTLDVRGDM
jgi:hypothetical protein